jgi:hypothetical protein
MVDIDTVVSGFDLQNGGTEHAVIFENGLENGISKMSQNGCSECPQWQPTDLQECIFTAIGQGLECLKEEQSDFLQKVDESMNNGVMEMIMKVEESMNNGIREMTSLVTKLTQMETMEVVCHKMERQVTSENGDVTPLPIIKVNSEMERQIDALIADQKGNECDITEMGNKTAEQPPRRKSIIGTRPASDDFDYHLDLLSRMETQNARSNLKKMRISRLCGCHCLDRVVSKRFVRLVHSAAFEGVCSVVMLLFACTVGAEAESNVQEARLNHDEPTWSEYPMLFFNFWFAMEVSVRVMADRADFFVGSDWRWNCFDLGLVLFSIVDLFSRRIAFFRVLRTFKVIRAVRVVRLVRWFHELRLMLASILSSLAALAWTVLFLVIVTFLCSVAFLQGAATHIRDLHNQGVHDSQSLDAMEKYFPSMVTAMYTLIGSITGGVDWMEAAAPLWNIGAFYGLAFVLFVLVSVLGILNVVTSMFVERASNMKKTDRDFAIADQLHTMRSDLKETLALFQELDKEQKGHVTKKQLDEFLRDDRVIAHFHTLGIDVTDRRRIESILVVGNNECVSLKEFVVGCVGLRGKSNKADIVMALDELHALLGKVNHLQSQINMMAYNIGEIKDTQEDMAASKWFAGLAGRTGSRSQTVCQQDGSESKVSQGL